MALYKRLLLIALIAVLLLAMVPLGGRSRFTPCKYQRQSMISFQPQGHALALPDDAIRPFPLLCMEIVRLRADVM